MGILVPILQCSYEKEMSRYVWSSWDSASYVVSALKVLFIVNYLSAVQTFGENGRLSWRRSPTTPSFQQMEMLDETQGGAKAG